MAVQKDGKEYNFAKKGMANLENGLFDNRGGTVLTRQPIDFGGADRIDLTEDTSPNFLGGAMRVHDFMAASLDELRQYSEEPQLGGM